MDDFHLCILGPNHTRGRQGKYLATIGRPCLPPATPHAGRVPAFLRGSGVWQCLPTRENPLVAEACRATSAGDNFLIFFKFRNQDGGRGSLCSSRPAAAWVLPSTLFASRTCGNLSDLVNRWHLPGYFSPSMQPACTCPSSGMYLIRSRNPLLTISI